MMSKVAWGVAIVAVVGVWVLVGCGGIPNCCSQVPDVRRSNCPGKIVCPLTGETICRDRCPLGQERGTGAVGMAPAPRSETGGD